MINQNLILCSSVYDQFDFKKIIHVIDTQEFVPSEIGSDSIISSIPLGIDKMFKRILGDQYNIKKSHSGKYRKPQNVLIKHDDIISADQWTALIILEQTTFNLMRHKSGAVNVFENNKVNYNYKLDWDYYSNLLLKPNDLILYRPWLFHTLEDGMVHHFTLIGS